MTLERWTLGETFNHPQYSQGRIEFVGSDYLGLLLNDGQQVLVRKTHFEDSRVTPPPVTEAVPELPWPQSTFTNDSAEEEGRHSMGSHWDAFADESIDILKRLPEFLQEARVQERFLAKYDDKHVVPDNWPKGAYLAWPHPNHGLSMVIAIQEGQNMLASVFPFIHAAKQHPIILRQVHVWENGLEAQITAAWGDASISFYDTQYLLNRGSYEADQPCEFLLMGLAYTARPARHIEMPVNHHPDEVAWFNLRHNSDDENMELTSTINFDNAAIFLPIEQWDRDDYQFLGPIQDVTSFSDWLGQDGWRVEVTVIREAGINGEDLTLSMYITHRAWKGDTPPTIGMNIEGQLWLQGTMVFPSWVTHRKKDKRTNL